MVFTMMIIIVIVHRDSYQISVAQYGHKFRGATTVIWHRWGGLSGIWNISYMATFAFGFIMLNMKIILIGQALYGNGG